MQAPVYGTYGKVRDLERPLCMYDDDNTWPITLFCMAASSFGLSLRSRLKGAGDAQWWILA